MIEVNKTSELYRDEILQESKFLESLFKGKNPYPIEVEFHLSRRCNRDCCYCWSRGTDYRSGQSSSSISKQDIFSLLGEFSENGVKRISFSGGKEPLMAEMLPEVIEYSKAKNFYVRLLSNGILLNGKHRQKITDSEVDWVRISLDSIKEETYQKIYNGNEKEMRLIINNLRKLAKEKGGSTRVGIGMLVQQVNSGQIMEMADFAHHSGVDFIDIRGLTEDKNETFTQEELSDILRQGEKAKQKYPTLVNFRSEMFSGQPLGKTERCWFGKYKAVIDFSGRVYDCCLTANPGMAKGHIMGKVTGSFHKVLKRKVKKNRLCSFCGYNELMINTAIEKLWQEYKGNGRR